jgi:hypothetical protein
MIAIEFEVSSLHQILDVLVDRIETRFPCQYRYQQSLELLLLLSVSLSKATTHWFTILSTRNFRKS